MITAATLGLGIIVLLGGVMGYAKAGSLPSIIMGTLFGLGLIGCGIALSKEVASWPLSAALACTSFLALFFCYRLVATGKPMPAAPMIALCLGWIALYFNS